MLSGGVELNLASETVGPLLNTVGKTIISKAERGLNYIKSEAGFIGKIPNPLANIRYTDKVIKQMDQDLYHGFPKQIDEFGAYGTIKPIKGGDGIMRSKIEIPGSFNDKTGVYQYIIEPDGVTVNHRLFVPRP